MSKFESTLAIRCLPTQTVTRDLSLIVGGVALTAALAQVQVPFQPVPFTLQTLSVMLVGLSLGARLGFLSMATYVGLGAAGAPIFAGFMGGPARLLGPTGGYLVAFVLVATLLGWMSDRGWTKSLRGSALALASGSLITLGLGTLWLSGFVGMSAALKLGFVPFVGGEAIKALIALPVIPAAWSLLGKASG